MIFWIGRALFLLVVILGATMTFYFKAPFLYFALSVLSFSGYLILEIILKKYLQQKPLIAKREISLAELSSIWTNRNELEALRKELQELRRFLEQGNLQNLEELQKNPVIQQYFGKIDEEKAEELAKKDDPVTIEKIVDNVKIIVADGEKNSPQVPNSKEKKEPASSNEAQTQEIRKIEESTKETKNSQKSLSEKEMLIQKVKEFLNISSEEILLIQNLNEEKLRRILEVYEKIKHIKPTLSCIIQSFISENECRIAYEAEKLREVGVDPKKFIDYVS